MTKGLITSSVDVRFWITGYKLKNMTNKKGPIQANTGNKNIGMDAAVLSGD